MARAAVGYVYDRYRERPVFYVEAVDVVELAGCRIALRVRVEGFEPDERLASLARTKLELARRAVEEALEPVRRAAEEAERLIGPVAVKLDRSLVERALEKVPPPGRVYATVECGGGQR